MWVRVGSVEKGETGNRNVKFLKRNLIFKVKTLNFETSKYFFSKKLKVNYVNLIRLMIPRKHFDKNGESRLTLFLFRCKCLFPALSTVHFLQV